MVFPVLTSAYAAVLGLIFAGLSGWVIAGRFQFGVLLGEGGNEQMQRRMRAHANFAEYVPLILLLVALLEASGAGHATVHALLLILVVARLMHPYGMLAPDGSPRQMVFRGVSSLATLLILTIAAAVLLARNL